MIDLNKLSNVVFEILDEAPSRCPIELVLERIVKGGSVPGFADAELDDVDRDTLVRAVVIASPNFWLTNEEIVRRF